MAGKIDGHWIFCDEYPAWKSIGRWRDDVKPQAEPAHKK